MRKGDKQQKEMKEDSAAREEEIFANAPVGKALASMIVPTIVSQVIIVIYNLADTWFVGLTENANAVAAVSLCLPVYTILSAISNLFGIGGAGSLLYDIVKGGIPGFCMVALAMFSNCFLNSIISTLGSEAVAGIGIVRKIDQLAYAVNQGVTQGMLPLVAYCYSSGRRSRMWKAVGISAVFSEGFSLICMAVSLIFSNELITIFIRDPKTIYFGAEFLRILCLAVPLYTLTFVIIAVFQAVGRGVEPFVLSVLHKGSLDIVLLFILRRLAGVERILWAAPTAEVIALITGIIMLAAFWKTLNMKYAQVR